MSTGGQHQQLIVKSVYIVCTSKGYNGVAKNFLRFLSPIVLW